MTSVNVAYCQVESTLERLLTTEAVKKRGMPSLGDLLSLPLFRDLTFSVISAPHFKLPKTLAARLLQCRDSQEKRLRADSKAVCLCLLPQRC